MNIEPEVNAWYSVSVALLTTYKQMGDTPLQALERLREEKNLPQEEKMTYAGRLDPAAEGLLLVLTGHDVHQKDSLLGLDKTYEFEVLFGLTTDSLDVLGVVVDGVVDSSNIALKILNSFSNFVGEFEWAYPDFSSKTVDGTPMFEKTRAGEEFEKPTRMMHIQSLDILGNKIYKLADLKNRIVNVVSSVQGDFRQEEILKRWDEVFETSGETQVCVCSFRARVSSGTYIRVLAQKMGESLGLPSCALSIKRTSIGTIEI